MGFIQKFEVRKSINMLPQYYRAKKKNMTTSIDAEKAFGYTQPAPFMLKINK